MKADDDKKQISLVENYIKTTIAWISSLISTNIMQSEHLKDPNTISNVNASHRL